MSTPVLEARGVVAGYGGVDVIRDINVNVCAGEVVCLLGANGAGKTTTMLVLSGVVRPRAGSVSWCGKPITEPLHRRVHRGLGFVAEERCIFPSLTTEENLVLGQGSVAQALAHVPELESLLSRRAGLLSGGEQQLLAVARILAAKPKVLLADEVSLGLAPIVTARLLAALRSAADAGAGVIIVEQHVSKALEVADRGYVLQRGRIALSGTADQLGSGASGLRDMYLSGASVELPSRAHTAAREVHSA